MTYDEVVAKYGQAGQDCVDELRKILPSGGSVWTMRVGRWKERARYKFFVPVSVMVLDSSPAGHRVELEIRDISFEVAVVTGSPYNLRSDSLTLLTPADGEEYAPGVLLKSLAGVLRLAGTKPGEFFIQQRTL